MSNHVPPPPGELRKVQVKFVSLVKNGANGRRFQVFKAAGYESPSDEPVADSTPKGLGELITAAVQKAFQALGLGKQADVRKEGDLPPMLVADPGLGDEDEPNVTTPPTFSGQMQAKEQRDAFWSAIYIFEDVVREIVWSAATNKAVLVSQAIEDFKNYLLPRVTAFSVQKAAGEPAVDTIDGDISNIEEGIAYVNVAKAGRKIAAGRLARLKEAHARLGEVITEAEKENEPDPQDPKEGDEEEVEVKKEELQEILKEALAPVEERLAKLEGEQAPAPDAETPSEENIAEVVKAAIFEVLAPLNERLAKVEKARGVSNAQPATPAAEVQKSTGGIWNGVFLGQ